MTTKNKILLQAANLLLCAAIILLTAFFMSGWSVLVQAAFYAVAAAGLAAEAVFLFIKKEFLIKLTFIAELIAVVLLAVFVGVGAEFLEHGVLARSLPAAVEHAAVDVVVDVDVLDLVDQRGVVPLPAAEEGAGGA